MKTQNQTFAALPILIAVAGLSLLPLLAHNSQAKPEEKKTALPEQKFEDLIELSFSGEVVSGTGSIDKGGFTIVTVQADKDRTKVAVSLATKQRENRISSDFKVLAVDATGKRYPAKDASSASAGGLEIAVITIVSEFNLKSDKIAALVVQQTASPAKRPPAPPVDHVDLPEF